MSLGEYTEANALLEKSVTTYTDLGIRDHPADMFLSSAKVHLGQYEEGRIRGQITLGIAREFDDRTAIGFALIVLGWVALVGKTYTEAESLFQKSIDACQEIEQWDMLSWGFAFLGYAERGLGRFAQAGQHFCRALQIATETQSFVALMFTLPGMALLLVDLDHKERAVDLYALASRYPMVANSRWFTDVVGRPIAAVAATLPPDVVAAAEERGRARDLETTIAELLAELEQRCF
jgi:tetratricopeptide (TPR) repeat protein